MVWVDLNQGLVDPCLRVEFSPSKVGVNSDQLRAEGSYSNTQLKTKISIYPPQSEAELSPFSQDQSGLNIGTLQFAEGNYAPQNILVRFSPKLLSLCESRHPILIPSDNIQVKKISTEISETLPPC